jgi:hypothetical protein
LRRRRRRAGVNVANHLLEEVPLDLRGLLLDLRGIDELLIIGLTSSEASMKDMIQLRGFHSDSGISESFFVKLVSETGIEFAVETEVLNEHLGYIREEIRDGLLEAVEDLVQGNILEGLEHLLEEDCVMDSIGSRNWGRRNLGAEMDSPGSRGK